MGEYAPLVRRLGGQVVEIAPGSPNHINPMDIQLDLDDDESPLSMKADFLLSLCELVVGGKDGLQPIEKTVIDRCVRLIYRDIPFSSEFVKLLIFFPSTRYFPFESFTLTKPAGPWQTAATTPPFS